MSDAASWILAVILAAPLLVLAVYDLTVARHLRNAAAIRPAIPFLSLVKGVIYGVTTAALIFAILGVQAVVFYLTGIRLLPSPIPFILIYLGCLVASLMVFRLRRWIIEK